MNSSDQRLPLQISAVGTKDQDSHLVFPASAGSLKRTRTCDMDDTENANLQWRKRALATILQQSQEERGLYGTSYFSADDTDSAQVHNKSIVFRGDDTSMFDCSKSGEGSTETFGVEVLSSNQGRTCFGTIFDAKAGFLDDEQSEESYALTLSTNPEIVQKFAISSRQGCFYLQSSNGRSFAVVHSRTTTALQTLQDISSIRLEAVLISGDSKKPGQKLRERKRTTFSISVDIYGSEEFAKVVGARLSKTHTYLQHPISLDSGVSYNNPHYYAMPGVAKAETSCIVPSPGREDEQVPLADIAKVFEDVECSRDLPRRTADWHVRTPLLEHQKEALGFVTQREAAVIDDGSSLWDTHEDASGNNYYQHTIVGSRRVEKPDLARGGIVADDMGLGKTLSMLAAIATSLEEARAFVCSQGYADMGSRLLGIRRARSTLVIAPSAVLLDGWQDEIQRHVNPGLLKVYKYHGVRKAINLDSLIEHDVVLTTYATLASDVVKRTSVLQQIMWFRVVLDEAHTIRHQSTQQFRAVYSLHAQRRWCITGTPIQNRLEDLGSLIRFLRVNLFDNSYTFRKYISEPLLIDPEAGDRNLRLFLRSLCLRRTRVLLDIPEAKESIVRLSLSTEERRIYSQVIEDTQREIDDSVSSRLITKAYSGIFQAILRLRLLCNNGTQQISCSSSEVESCCSDDEVVAGGMLACPLCSCEITVTNEQDNISAGASLRRSTQLLCPACLSPNEIYAIENQEKLKDERSASARLMQETKIADNASPQSYSEDRVSSASIRPNLLPDGHSSKMSALMRNIEEHLPSDKSIVFSCWKSTLNLLEVMLEAVGIHYVRIDGSTSTIERNRIVRQFQEDPETKLLLMTTGTGAVGLNLTAATRIHLIEPQWNPAIENQAIGRALRLGQTRTVTIVRYLVEKTIEESIQSRQVMKLQLAKLTLGKEDAREQTVLQRLEDLRSLLYKY